MNASPARIVLLGLRGSGKSTIGRALADALAVPFTDLDDLLRRHFNAPSIAHVWNSLGQDAFRAAESRLLPDLLAGPGVLALGGGTPTAPGAADLLNHARTHRRISTVYLRATPHTLRRRLAATGAGPDRPSLTGADPLDEIDHVFADRDSLYTSLADLVLDTDPLTPRQTLHTLRASL